MKPVVSFTPPSWSDLVGKRFGRLVALGYTGDQSPNGQKRITVLCDCGNYKGVMPTSLRSGATTSCGCRRGEVCAARNVESAKHGEASGGKVSPEYAAWQAMRNRCTPGNVNYKNYGARGITVCERWRDSLENFLEDVGRRPSPAYSLDRIDNDQGYFPGNVRWATATQQVRNRRGVKLYEMDGESLTLAEWAERKQIPLQRLYQRIVKFGWSFQEAIDTPIGRVVDRSILKARWYAMIMRCTDSTCEQYPNYGGRGIQVCARWRDSFDDFADDVGLPPTVDDYSLDRINNDGNYEPGNVRWATPTVQGRNRRSTRRFDLYGESKTLAEWSQLAKADYATTKRRVSVGWDLAEALGTPRDSGVSPRNRIAWSPGGLVARFDNTHTEWPALSDDAKQSLIQDALAAYRASGFPWDVLRDDTRDPLQSVARSAVTVVDDVIISKGNAGQRTCQAVHLHRLEAKHGKQMSVVEAFADDKMLTRALLYQLKCGDPISPKRLLRAIMALVRAPRNFPPVLARWIVDEHAPQDGAVLDPCSGYGGRLLGALASKKNVTYLGADVEPKSVAANIELAQVLGQSSRVEQRLQSVEDPTEWPRADLVILGPPYYDLEFYGQASRDLLRVYPTYESWRDGFLRTLIRRSLEAAPVVVVNVAAVNKGKTVMDLPADAAALTEALGGCVERVLSWPLRAFGKVGREEKLLVLRRS